MCFQLIHGMFHFFSSFREYSELFEIEFVLEKNLIKIHTWEMGTQKKMSVSIEFESHFQ
jgi:hypothetical protein